MKQYTEQEYKNTFGEQAWREKVLIANDGDPDGGKIESVYATDNGNIFMIMRKDVL